VRRFLACGAEGSKTTYMERGVHGAHGRPERPTVALVSNVVQFRDGSVGLAEIAYASMPAGARVLGWTVSEFPRQVGG
jgi:hypothetical protein